MVKEIKIKDAAQLDRISRLAWDAPYEINLHTGAVSMDVRDITPTHMDDLVGRTVCLVAGDNADPIHFGCLVEQMEGNRKSRRTLRERMDAIINQMEPCYGWEIRLKRIQC
ncbi:MAG: hypothetical protein J6J87_04135 [Oscillospiraceae bacterium]|nr:hypothetical protein [Oscillospiraceae bacterium]